METRGGKKKKLRISLSTSAFSSADEQRLSWDRLEQLPSPEHPRSRMSATYLPPAQMLLAADQGKYLGTESPGLNVLLCACGQ